MSRIRLVSVDPPGQVVDLADEDSAAAFRIAEELRSTVLDVLADDKYAFSLYRLGGNHGYWALFQRADIAPFRRIARAK